MNMSYLTNANNMYMVSLIATHKEQIIDVILTSWGSVVISAITPAKGS